MSQRVARLWVEGGEEGWTLGQEETVEGQGCCWTKRVLFLAKLASNEEDSMVYHLQKVLMLILMMMMKKKKVKMMIHFHDWFEVLIKLVDLKFQYLQAWMMMMVRMMMMMMMMKMMMKKGEMTIQVLDRVQVG